MWPIFLPSHITTITPRADWFLRSLYETITSSIGYLTSSLSSIRKSCLKTFLPLPIYRFNFMVTNCFYATSILIYRTKHVYALLEKIYRHTLFNLHDVLDNLQYWKPMSNLYHNVIVFNILGTSLAIFLLSEVPPSVLYFSN